jgi:O-antigen/teichoic acid export membrane protein
MASSRSVGTKTLRGMVWSYTSYVGGRMLTLVATVILARLLSPHDFGLVALALLLMTLLETLSDLGVTQALVIVKEEDELETAETAFVWTLGLGVAFSAITAALGPALAAFFDQPALVGIVPALGLRFLLRSLSATHYALAQKRIDFRSRTAGELSDVIIRGITSISLAVAGFGAWSLVIGYLAGSVALSVVLWIMVPWRPRLRPQRKHLSHMLRFGGMLTAVDISAAIFSNTDYTLIGRVLGATQLGLYTLGFRLPELLIGNMSVVAGRVLFPAFAAIERGSVSDAFQRSLGYTLMFVLPLTAGLALLADPFIFALFGYKWEDSIPVMQLLTLYAFGIAIGIPAGTAYKATGRAGVLLALSIPRTCIAIAAIAIFVHKGIVAVAACLAIVTSVFAVIGIMLAMKLLTVGLVGIWRAVWPSLTATAGMTAVLVPIERGIGSPWIALALGGTLGSLAYVALLWLFARDSLLRLRDTAFPRRAPPGDLLRTGETDSVV